MTDWKAIATAKGLPAPDAVVLPLQALEAQFAALRADIRLDSEPVTHYVLPLPESSR
jgi:hypothetical protein